MPLVAMAIHVLCHNPLVESLSIQRSTPAASANRGKTGHGPFTIRQYRLKNSLDRTSFSQSIVHLSLKEMYTICMTGLLMFARSGASCVGRDKD